MSVYLRYEPDGLSGVIPEGSYLWEATRRLGVRLRAECGGRGQCDSCAVIVEAGLELLSAPTMVERERLTNEQLSAGWRLACQTLIERGGELVVREAVAEEKRDRKDEEEPTERLRREFLQMPFERKLAALLEFEAITVYQALDVLARLPSKAGEKLLDWVAARGRALEERQRQDRRAAGRQRSKE